MKQFIFAGLLLVGAALGGAGTVSAAGGCGQNAATFTNPAGHVIVCPARASTQNCGVLSSGQFTNAAGRVIICPVVPVGR